MPICYAKISMLTGESHGKKTSLKDKDDHNKPDPAAMINLKTIQMTFH